MWPWSSPGNLKAIWVEEENEFLFFFLKLYFNFTSFTKKKKNNFRFLFQFFFLFFHKLYKLMLMLLMMTTSCWVQQPHGRYGCRICQGMERDLQEGVKKVVNSDTRGWGSFFWGVGCFQPKSDCGYETKTAQTQKTKWNP